MSGIIRKCIYCGQEDDHPKHETVHPGMVSVYAHYDCCAEVTGCGPVNGYEGCVAFVERTKGKRGEELRKHLMSGKV